MNLLSICVGVVEKVVATIVIAILLASAFPASFFVANAAVEGGPIVGCMEVEANNYNPDATSEDGSCTYDAVPVIYGCTNDAATNYDPLATLDDESC